LLVGGFGLLLAGVGGFALAAQGLLLGAEFVDFAGSVLLTGCERFDFVRDFCAALFEFGNLFFLILFFAETAVAFERGFGGGGA
jgi:hypothetical protein